MTPHEKLKAAIAKKDQERGRKLTGLEKLANLSKALYGDDRMVSSLKAK